MKNKPINEEAYAYVRLCSEEEISLEDFVPIEFFVAQMHDNLYPDGIFGDGDLLNFVINKLEEKDINISLQKVKFIVNSLYNFMLDTGRLLPITSSIKIKEWKLWRQVADMGIENFISLYNYSPNTIHLSHFTKTQIELVSGGIHFSTYFWKTLILNFSINNDLEDKILILEYEEDDDNKDGFIHIPMNIIVNHQL